MMVEAAGRGMVGDEKKHSAPAGRRPGDLVDGSVAHTAIEQPESTAGWGGRPSGSQKRPGGHL